MKKGLFILLLAVGAYAILDEADVWYIETSASQGNVTEFNKAIDICYGEKECFRKRFPVSKAMLLHLALMHFGQEHPEVVLKLSSMPHARVSLVDPATGTSAFIEACVVSKTITENWLDKMGVNAKKIINQVGGDAGYTPLLYAIDRKMSDIASLLISRGADINQRSNDHATFPLMHCVKRDDKMNLRALMQDNNIAMNNRDDKGNVALHMAVVKQDLDAVEMLLAKDAEIQIRAVNYYGYTPITILEMYTQYPQDYPMKLGQAISKHFNIKDLLS
jgi:hypothetical protein